MDNSFHIKQLIVVVTFDFYIHTYIYVTDCACPFGDFHIYF